MTEHICEKCKEIEITANPNAGAKTKKDYDNYIICAVLVVAFIAVAFAGHSLFKFYFPSAASAIETVPTGIAAASAMQMTEFDKQLAKQMMDKDNDGRCDTCGMPVEMCMGSGQLQCNMDPKSTIGILGSQHIHADFKIYINDKLLDFSDYAHMERMRAGLPVSSFIHVDSGAPPPEKTGNVLHMHATGVPLWLFFKSIGLELPAGMKAYVNGIQINDWQNYVFNDLDRILITDDVTGLQGQLNSITNFAKSH